MSKDIITKMEYTGNTLSKALALAARPLVRLPSNRNAILIRLLQTAVVRREILVESKESIFSEPVYVELLLDYNVNEPERSVIKAEVRSTAYCLNKVNDGVCNHAISVQDIQTGSCSHCKQSISYNRAEDKPRTIAWPGELPENDPRRNIDSGTSGYTDDAKFEIAEMMIGTLNKDPRSWGPSFWQGGQACSVEKMEVFKDFPEAQKNAVLRLPEIFNKLNSLRKDGKLVRFIGPVMYPKRKRETEEKGPVTNSDGPDTE